MKNRTFSALLLLGASVALFGGCKKDSDAVATTGSVNFTVQNVAAVAGSATPQPLVLYSTIDTTPTGEQFTVSRFEYYLSNLKFTKRDGTTYAAPDTYYLVNQDKPASLSFSVPNVPVGDYTGVSFLVGVDAQKTGLTDPSTFTGDLNQANNMYWTWSSGHIFLKLEGTLVSANPTKNFLCHIGGYTDPYNALVTAAPSFGGSTLTVRTDRVPTVALQANVDKLFTGSNIIKLGDLTDVMMPSAQSVQMAKNYGASMFSITQISTN